MQNELKNKLAENMETPIDTERYNPITNPIPWMNHNPYISKEKNSTLRNSSTTKTLLGSTFQ